ncbi:asparagine synthetase [Aspergillus flavus]|uniref:Asparagine synthetase n=2 Tax=Aspergillus flavus TaxID=5059 RepID=A0A7U2N0F3_ASPFN|nr:uncharacterized protein G4B84_011372 [Aspergillus flavus NRRL3357]KAJ1713391.1 asparagine synthetase [Aspergillus flavus]KAF7629463.1 hypothetical protein AFLA_013177 [Aspergillus flavus NRRL3357]QMW35843.1 hypothetical protein G4B84_011372 [Aspergillus flavus NRRL3357]QMW47905.1 hypothetical protein G4B11_011423 [Aspergillus flavus]QRD93233.1 asparagine synthetase [Aspergillus flavus]
MCGIGAFLDFHNHSQPVSHQQLESEIDNGLDFIKHRGPDARGKWVNADGRVGLGHIRLSIVDPSPSGNQPFHDSQGDIHAVVNGELYDHERYREQLASEFDFKGNSDCEIVIALYKHYGASFLSHLRGEFALVLWDAKRELFFAARDRYGIKSLYYTLVNNRLLVATEMKSFLAFGWKPEWCIRSLRSLSWQHGSNTFFKGVYNIRPGHYLLSQSFGPLEQTEYWDCEFPDKRALEPRSEEEIILGLRKHLLEAVKLRLRADVPAGVYLSGGLDSTAVAGMVSHLMKNGERLGNNPDGLKSQLHCFTVQFDRDSGYDESDVAERTATWLGANCHLVPVDEAVLAAGFEDTIWFSESPLPDLCGVGKLALAEAVHKEGIKVVLTGEGADEHFGGYSYLRLDALAEPDPSWPAAQFPESERLQMHEKLYRQVDSSGSVGRVESAERMLNGSFYGQEMAYFNFLPFASWTDLYASVPPHTALAESFSGSTRDRMMNKWHLLHTSEYISIKTFLSTFILRNAGDNVDMVHQVESRPPFLDHRVTEYANQIPPSLKMSVDPVSKTFRDKHILREAVKPFIPDEIYSRPKRSYAAPVRYPKDGPLCQLFNQLVTEENVKKLGFVDWGKAKGNLHRAFEGSDDMAFRFTLTLAQFVVLMQRFGVATCCPSPNALS